MKEVKHVRCNVQRGVIQQHSMFTDLDTIETHLIARDFSQKSTEWHEHYMG